MENKYFRKYLVILTIILFVGASILPSIGGSNSKNREINLNNVENIEFVSGEIIIKFKSEVNIDISTNSKGIISTGIHSINVLNEKYNVLDCGKLFNTREKPYLYNIFKFIVSEHSDILSIVKDYSSDPNVIYAEPNYIFRTCLTPNDPDFNLQYHLDNTGQTGGLIDADIDAPEAWDIETGDENIVICIHDTGVDWDHPDLADNIWINSGEDLNGNGVVDPSDFNDIDDDNNGYIDDIPLEKTTTFETNFHQFMEANHPKLGKNIAKEKEITAKTEEVLKKAINEFKKSQAY